MIRRKSRFTRESWFTCNSKIKSNQKSKVGESWFTHLRIIFWFDFESKANQSELRIKLIRALPEKAYFRIFPWIEAAAWEWLLGFLYCPWPFTKIESIHNELTFTPLRLSRDLQAFYFENIDFFFGKIRKKTVTEAFLFVITVSHCWAWMSKRVRSDQVKWVRLKPIEHNQRNTRRYSLSKFKKIYYQKSFIWKLF